MKKLALVTALSVMAVAVPTFGLATWFGTDVAVESNSVEHLLALVAAAVFAFVVGVFSTRIATQGNVNMFDALEITVGRRPS